MSWCTECVCHPEAGYTDYGGKFTGQFLFTIQFGRNNYLLVDCSLPPVAGDGNCDQENNVEECNFDGGDCDGPEQYPGWFLSMHGCCWLGFYNVLFLLDFKNRSSNNFGA